MKSALTLIFLFSLLNEAIGEVALAATGNHVPRLHHPKGLTADRKSQGAQSLRMPSGYIEGGVNKAMQQNVAHEPSSLSKMSSSRVASGNHKPLLSHPAGQTADSQVKKVQDLAASRSYIARSSVQPQGVSVSKNIPSSLRAAPIGASLPSKLMTPKKKSWFASLLGQKEEGLKAPERVTAWDIDIESTAVKPSNRLPPPQHLGASYSRAGIPPHLRNTPEKDNGVVSKFLQLVHLK